jgi:branched-chain amino acid transport system ATP-binding protein
MLELDALRVSYGPVQAVRGASLTVGTGEVVGLVGANGAGKTSTLNAILGLVPITAGQIKLDGRELGPIPTPGRINAGLALVPQGRQLFGGLSVADNLRVGSWLRRGKIDPLELLRDFPGLHSRLRQAAGTLSGGEQQMVAIARAMASQPTCLLLDEPSMGLSPIVIDRVADAIGELVRERGLTVLLVDQGVGMVARLADRAYVMVHGEIADELDAEALKSRAIERAYFG